MTRVVFLVFATLLSASAQNLSYSGTAGSSATTTLSSAYGVSSTPAPDYIIGAEDVLQVNVWKEPDISSSVPVRPDGKISLPLLNDVQAAGLTPMQLAADISARLREFLQEPRVTVIVTAMNSRRAYVMGKVTRQGAVLLISNLTVLQALSAAGGPIQFANTHKMYVLRTAGGKQVKLPFDYPEVIKGKNPEQNIMLRPGDTVVVP
jgi:polysaccharide export outer membrane protein